MAKRFAEHTGLDLTKTNNEVLEMWNRTDVFHRSITEREGHPQFVFYEGPPSANGHPGIHHVLGRALKDAFNRYKTMKGYQVKRKAGWDTHGLPVELSVEKQEGITKADIVENLEAKREREAQGHKAITIEDYNKKCRENVMMYTSEWRELTEKLGFFVDLDNPYITYDNKYIETLWWLLKQLYQKGLLYKGYTIQPYSPAAGTGLSSHELNQPGCYRDVKDTTVTAQFRITDPRPEMNQWGTPVFLAWTTTPWTLPSNTALCVGPRIDYVCLQTYNPYNGEKISAVMAAPLVDSYLKPEGEFAPMDEFKPGDKVIPYRVVGQYKGSDLVGMHYHQLMPWVKPCEKLQEGNPKWITEYAEAHQDKLFSVGKDQFVEMEDLAFRVIPGDYVTTDDGTGIVHIAPTFGADDAKVAKDAGVPALFLINKGGETRPMVDLQGKYYVMDELAEAFVEACVNTDNYSRHAGDYVKNAYDPKFNVNGYDEKAAAKAEDLNIVICMEMKQEGSAYKIEKHVHNYPHCWRTDKPVLYYPLDSWFIRSTACKDRMVELNKTINWKPESTGTGRFGNWLENLNDWNLSRSRFWGTPLPIWRNKDTREELCIGSVEELYNEIEKSVAAGCMKSNPLKEKGFVPGDMSRANYDRIDLHRPYVDDIILVSESGKPMHRESDLIDVWFDSGAMPYAQAHYPFENREAIDNGTAFPADFINEGVDQTRGWFFTLHAIGTMCFDSVAFKNVISTGLVLDAKGIKMSKRIGNVVNPFHEIERNGADAVRFYMLTNTQPWDNLKYDPAGVDEVRRKFFGTLYNTYGFFALYANVDGWEPSRPVSIGSADTTLPEIDRWILSCLNSLIKGVDAALADYEPTRAGRLIDTFVNDDLSNWYVRLNRKRFWGKDMSDDKRSAYQTLYTCLMTVAKLLAPFAPFYADQLYKDLGGELDSVHLDTFPTADETAIDEDLEARMQMAQKITSMVLALRRKVNIKVRQPLKSIMIPAVDEQQRKHIEAVKDLIMSEVNVKELKFVEGSGVLVKKVKCNFRTMGKKFGKLMKGIAAEMTALSQERIAQLEEQGFLDLNIEGEAVKVEAADVEIISEDIPGWLVSNEGNLTVALEIELTDELRREGMARELINRIQNLRKDNGFEITDRVRVYLGGANDFVREAVNAFGKDIATSVLADQIIFEDNDGPAIDFDDFEMNIKVEKC